MRRARRTKLVVTGKTLQTDPVIDPPSPGDLPRWTHLVDMRQTIPDIGSRSVRSEHRRHSGCREAVILAGPVGCYRQTSYTVDPSDPAYDHLLRVKRADST